MSCCRVLITVCSNQFRHANVYEKHFPLELWSGASARRYDTDYDYVTTSDYPTGSMLDSRCGRTPEDRSRLGLLGPQAPRKIFTYMRLEILATP